MDTDSKTLAERYKLVEKHKLSIEPQLLILHYSPDGKLLVAGGYDGQVRRWNAADNDLPELAPLAGHSGWLQALAFSQDSATLFTADSWGKLQARAASEANPAAKWSHDAAHEGWIRDLTLSPDGNTLATCGWDRTIRFWNPTDGAKQGELKGDNDDLYCLRYSPDGTQLLAGDRLGNVWQWEVASKKLVRKFDAQILYKLDRIQDVGGVRAIAFDKTGTWLAIGGMKPKNGATIQGIPSVMLFDFKSGELKHTHDLGGINDCEVADMKLHDDGFFLAVTNGGAGAGRIVMQKFGEKEPFFLDTKYVNLQSLAWHPEGKRFAVFGTNNGSNANGRAVDKDGKYVVNNSPLMVFEFAGMQGF